MRYDQLLTFIDEIKPRSIVEVGVARGERAKAMVLRALKYGLVEYTGYDVFETKDAAFHKAAFNAKQVSPLADCAHMMRNIQQTHPGLTFRFIVGDTRDTLHGETVIADLAFIDGDHRVEAIRKDFEALKQSRVIVLDDYYTADKDGGCPDRTIVGCNELVRTTGAHILPDMDPVRGGGLVQMAVVR